MSTDFNIKPGYVIKTLNDSEKGSLKFRNVKIMELLFYQIKLGTDSQNFFKKVFETFCPEYNEVNPKSVDVLIEKVKKIKNAASIKKLFSKAKEQLELRNDVDITNLNTTALCMLHYNIPSISKLQRPLEYNFKINIVKKFDGTNRTRFEDQEYLIFPYLIHWDVMYHNKSFPNCLLTSDSFLKKTTEVDALYNKYKYYWSSFWLFQVPHHGSSNSAGVELFSRLPFMLTKFINYGTTHRFIKKWQHPSPKLIDDLISSGHSTNILPANEFTGLKFNVAYYRL